MAKKHFHDETALKESERAKVAAEMLAQFSEWDLLQLFAAVADSLDWVYQIKAMGGVVYQRQAKRKIFR